MLYFCFLPCKPLLSSGRFFPRCPYITWRLITIPPPPLCRALAHICFASPPYVRLTLICRVSHISPFFLRLRKARIVHALSSCPSPGQVCRLLGEPTGFPQIGRVFLGLEFLLAVSCRLFFASVVSGRNLPLVCIFFTEDDEICSPFRRLSRGNSFFPTLPFSLWGPR